MGINFHDSNFVGTFKLEPAIKQNHCTIIILYNKIIQLASQILNNAYLLKSNDDKINELEAQ